MRAMSQVERSEAAYIVEHYKDLARMHAALSVGIGA
jgi:hypothetical protein